MAIHYTQRLLDIIDSIEQELFHAGVSYFAEESNNTQVIVTRGKKRFSIIITPASKKPIDVRILIKNESSDAFVNMAISKIDVGAIGKMVVAVVA